MNDFEWVSSAIQDAKYQLPKVGHAHRKQKLGLEWKWHSRLDFFIPFSLLPSSFNSLIVLVFSFFCWAPHLEGKVFGKDFSRRRSRINTDRFPKWAPKAQASKGVRGRLPPGNFLDSNSFKSPFLTDFRKTVETGVDPRLSRIAGLEERTSRWLVMEQLTFVRIFGSTLHRFFAACKLAATKDYRGACVS